MDVADKIIELLQHCENLKGGFAVNQLEHCLQSATLAERDGADDELIVACLCHDAGKVISRANHGGIIAAIFKPYVREEVYWLLKMHQLFEGKHYFEYLGRDPNQYLQYKDEPWYDLCQKFADKWDCPCFDPDFKSLPLIHFIPKVRKVFQKTIA